jgi:ATP adenylyltransferase
MNEVFDRLRSFLVHGMRMSHVYQPVMIRELLRRQGEATTEQIARALLQEDRSQVDYYKQIVRQMVGRVLTKNRGLTTRHRDHYALIGYPELSGAEVGELIEICDGKIAEYLEKRQDPWSHRRRSAGYVPGTLRYEVLKRARFRCELCGVSAEQRALEVDHILPRNRGGSDDLSNLQALCYSCNATKRDRDDTDFRRMADLYSVREQGCPFCEIDAARVVARSELCYAIRDAYPVTPLHTLVIPARHSGDFFDLVHPERTDLCRMLDELKGQIVSEDTTVTGFNVGMNAGSSAGQTIFHCHVHLIPRRDGDVADPRGGVRGVIPDKQAY